MPRPLRPVQPRAPRFGAALRGLLGTTLGLGLLTPARSADVVPLVSAEATYANGPDGVMAQVIDGVEEGPLGWSIAPHENEPQAAIFRTARPVEVAELDITLFFRSGQIYRSIEELALASTTDDTPSLNGNWVPLEVERFNTELATLRRTETGHLRADPSHGTMTGLEPDDTYRITVKMPAGRATGFRLQVFPVSREELSRDPNRQGMKKAPRDFVLTEFRVEEHHRATTNIALHCRVTASHALFKPGMERSLTDGLPATLAHPLESGLGAAFHFDLDLGRVATLDHLGLRGRGDGYVERYTRLRVQSYETDPAPGGAPEWEGLIRADGSFQTKGAVDLVRADQGKGSFRGRYLRLSSDNPVPMSPQLAEVEVYETRTPVVVEASADGKALPCTDGLDIPAGVRRLSLRLRIPQLGRPADVLWRWRVSGEQESWVESRLNTVDLPCPPPGRTRFEAQALHSDGQWDASFSSLPIVVRQYFWTTPLFQWTVGLAGLLLAGGLGRFWTQRRAAHQLALSQARAGVAEERTRIARDLHDDLGANLARIGFLTELVDGDLHDPAQARLQLEKIQNTARELSSQLDTVVWAVDPLNDTLESLARYLHGHAEEYLTLANVRCNFSNPDKMPELHVPARFRHQVLMIAKEALHNVVAHAAATVATLHFSVEAGWLVLEITDDGRGLPEAERLKPGNGLANMRKRAEEFGGRCAFLAPASGTGLKIRVEIPLPSSHTLPPAPSA